MADSEPLSIAEQIAARKKQLTEIRAHAATLLGDGAAGRQITAYLSDATNRLLVSMIESTAAAAGSELSLIHI